MGPERFARSSCESHAPRPGAFPEHTPGRSRDCNFEVVVFNGIAPHPLGDQFDRYRGVVVAGFSARATIKRSSFGMTAGGGEKGDAAELSIEAEGWRRP